ncbi:FKBP-type peptidyl-prolyl cis-trans isomerase [Lishizhenia sp.]|uniref:FKBP-type peptidyl-prolyl cis-trans isomerase n=1 Tax=Lishizhenia sp. TaxID=2497594 RepID=UPI00299D233D|nr:FKBP-type peptidyl-prolyl cis-trans isomerase [Lishizhenia sp.]MDX1445882.1 FKBP-type peptidyl-prolyl cis-trans isomerase [Lishizhenia sp.]
MLKSFRILPFLAVFTACTSTPEVEDTQPTSWSTDQSVEMNQRFAFEQEVEIKVYLKRHPELEMKKTETGLQYDIYKDSAGPTIQEDEVAHVKFLIQLLDEDTVYQSEGNTTSSFKVDKSDVELGLHQGIKMMSVGDRAKFIMPSHLAHGLLGDMQEIPPLEVIVADIELTAITSK